MSLTELGEGTPPNKMSTQQDETTTQPMSALQIPPEPPRQIMAAAPPSMTTTPLKTTEGYVPCVQDLYEQASRWENETGRLEETAPPAAATIMDRISKWTPWSPLPFQTIKTDKTVPTKKPEKIKDGMECVPKKITKRRNAADFIVPTSAGGLPVESPDHLQTHIHPHITDAIKSRQPVIENEIAALNRRIQFLENDLRNAIRKLDKASEDVDQRKSMNKDLDRISMLESQLGQVKLTSKEPDKKYEKIENEIAALNRRIQFLENDLRNAIRKLDKASEDVDQRKSMNKDLDRISMLESQLRQVKLTSKEPDKKYEKIENEIAALNRRIQFLENDLRNAIRKLDKASEDVDQRKSMNKDLDRISMLESQLRQVKLTSKEPDKKYEKIENEIAALNRRIQFLENDLRNAIRKLDKASEDVDQRKSINKALDRISVLEADKKYEKMANRINILEECIERAEERASIADSVNKALDRISVLESQLGQVKLTSKEPDKKYEKQQASQHLNEIHPEHVPCLQTPAPESHSPQVQQQPNVKQAEPSVLNEHSNEELQHSNEEFKSRMTLLLEGGIKPVNQTDPSQCTTSVSSTSDQGSIQIQTNDPNAEATLCVGTQAIYGARPKTHRPLPENKIYRKKQVESQKPDLNSVSGRAENKKESEVKVESYTPKDNTTSTHESTEEIIDRDIQFLKVLNTHINSLKETILHAYKTRRSLLSKKATSQYQENGKSLTCLTRDVLNFSKVVSKFNPTNFHTLLPDFKCEKIDVNVKIFYLSLEIDSLNHKIRDIGEQCAKLVNYLKESEIKHAEHAIIKGYERSIEKIEELIRLLTEKLNIYKNVLQ